MVAPEGTTGAPLHDLIAAVLLLRGDLARTVRCEVEVSEHSGEAVKLWPRRRAVESRL